MAAHPHIIRRLPVEAALSALLLLWAIGIHAQMLAALPDPVIHMDSAGYLRPALRGLFGGGSTMNIERTPAYPLFLLALLKTIPKFFGVLVVQHGLILCAGIAAGGIYLRLFGRSLVGAAAIFFLSSSLPTPALYAHMILTETAYTFLLVASVALFLYAKDDGGWSLPGVVGLSVSLAVLTRPVGWSLIGALGIASLAGRRRAPARKALGLTLALLMSVCLWNYRRHGFFGTDQMSGPALFCSTARYLNPERIRDPKARNALLPIYAQHPVEMTDGQWVYGSASGPVHALRTLYPPNEFYALLRRLSYQAIENHPARFAADRARILRDFFLTYSGTPGIYLDTAFTFFIYRGLRIFGSMVGNDSRPWTLLTHGPREADAYYARIRPLASENTQAPEAILRQVEALDVYHYDRVLRWWGPLRWMNLRWLPLLAGLSALFLWRTRKNAGDLLIFGVVILGHAAICTMAAFQDPRFAVPVAPFYWILAIAGIEAILRAKGSKPI